MADLGGAIRTIRRIDETAHGDTWLHRLHPLAKLLVTFAYIICVVSFSPDNLGGLLGMMLYPLVLFLFTELSFGETLRRMRIVLPLVMVVGIFNPIFDKTPAVLMEGLVVRHGWITCISLMLKGVLTVLAGYLLIASTPMEGIVYAMRRLHIPQIFTTEVMLIYRYLTLLLSEVKRTQEAYALRAPGQKGIHISAWGSLVGQILLRSMDRADAVFASMQLRGFNGEMPYGEARAMRKMDWIYLAVVTAGLILLRFVPLMVLIGGLVITGR